MIDVSVDRLELNYYHDDLMKQRDRLESAAYLLSSTFSKLDWDDNFWELMRQKLNGHINEVNRTLADLQRCITASSKLSEYLEEYLALK